MLVLEGISENLSFMVHEVVAQVTHTQQFFAEPTRTLMEEINSKDNYIDTLKSLIQDRSFDMLRRSTHLDKHEVIMLRTRFTIAVNLERVADFAVNMTRQAQHLNPVTFFHRFDSEPLFDEVLTGLGHIQNAINRRDISLAFRVCQCEFSLDEMYGQNFKLILEMLRSGEETGNLVTALMIFHYLERMGDSLLNIGEAIIHTIIGENLKIQQYQGLRDSLSAAGLETPISQVEFESIWGTRSGCRIGLVGDKEPDPEQQPVLFKHGNARKLKKEKENIEIWEKLVPGLPPRVKGFQEGENGDGSILLEYLPGCNFQEIVLSPEDQMMSDALFMIEEIVGHVWQATMQPERVNANFIKQIRERMDGVFRLHPEFISPSRKIGDLAIPSLGELLSALERCEQDLYAKFSVFIHGDFNANNLIYDSRRERIHFIDLHRSARSDFVQDVSVFLVSLFRLPVFDAKTRGRLNYAIMDFFEFARKFASQHEDDTFEARLAFGLARSFFTSTRFELNRRFARKMNRLSVYLLDNIQAHGSQPWESFRLPVEVLIY